jgi:hypothetical protein
MTETDDVELSDNGEMPKENSGSVVEPVTFVVNSDGNSNMEEESKEGSVKRLGIDNAVESAVGKEDRVSCDSNSGSTALSVAHPSGRPKNKILIAKNHLVFLLIRPLKKQDAHIFFIYSKNSSCQIKKNIVIDVFNYFFIIIQT